MSRMHIEQESCRTYLIWEPETVSGKADYGIKMMQNNTFNYFLPFQLRSTDQCVKYYYNLMSDTSLGQQMEKGMGLKELELFAASLLGALDEAGEYLLDENDILLDTACIFYTHEEKYRFLYYPGYQVSVSGQLKDLAGAFLKAVDYTCNGAVQRAYEFYHLCCGESTVLRDLRGFVLKGRDFREKSRAASDPDPGQTPSIPQNLKTEAEDVQASKILYKEAEKKDDEISQTTDNPSKEPPAGLPWAILGGVCLAQTGVGVILLKVFHRIPFMAGVGILIAAAAATAVIGAIIILLKNRGTEDDDFWKPQDDVPAGTGTPYVESGGADREEQSSRAGLDGLSGRTDGSRQKTDHETVVLSSPAPGIILKSANPQLYGNVSVSRFPAVIGKEAMDMECRVRIPTVSRRHAKIEAVGKNFCLTDLRSTNGTFINGEMLRPMAPAALHEGDSVILGDAEFIFELWGETQ